MPQRPDASSPSLTLQQLRDQWKKRGEDHEDAESSELPEGHEVSWRDGVHHGAAGAYAVVVAELDAVLSPLIEQDKQAGPEK